MKKMVVTILLSAGIIISAVPLYAENTEIADISDEWKKAGSEIGQAAHAVEEATVESSRAIWKTTKEESSKAWKEAKEKGIEVWELGKAKLHEASAPGVEDRDGDGDMPSEL